MNLVDFVFLLLRLLIGLSFNPEVIITEHFDFMHISAALILEIIPPLQSLEADPAMSLIFFVINKYKASSFFWI